MACNIVIAPPGANTSRIVGHPETSDNGVGKFVNWQNDSTSTDYGAAIRKLVPSSRQAWDLESRSTIC